MALVLGPFTWSGYQWNASTGTAPPAGNLNGNVGTFDPDNVAVGSELVITLTQTIDGVTVASSGGEVSTVQKFSYGTFSFTSRVSVAESGQIATGFTYITSSVNEIDMEQAGDAPTSVDCSSFRGLSISEGDRVFGYDQGNTHNFDIVWQPAYVDWYVDGVLICHHTKSVPTASAPFLFSMWGTNSDSFGGLATAGTRFITVSNFKYTPGLFGLPPTLQGRWQ